MTAERAVFFVSGKGCGYIRNLFAYYLTHKQRVENYLKNKFQEKK